ncbi:MAG: hypothetical protein M5T61_19715, partial [Acidimicrobiia bacterium]|nr:hypothetical protein [Acidimicrobiia bacterium]
SSEASGLAKSGDPDEGLEQLPRIPGAGALRYSVNSRAWASSVSSFADVLVPLIREDHGFTWDIKRHLTRT